jgi:hypothetical protein
MPKEKACLKLIPRIYKRNAEDLGLFFSVKAQQKIVPTVTIEQAIWNYFAIADIDDWDMECAKTIYFRMQNEYFEDCKE